MQLIIHPGYAKCGSSSIQSFLYSNCQYLEDLGVYLPDKAFRFSFESNAEPLHLIPPNSYFEELITAQDWRAFETRLAQILAYAHEKKYKAILVSSELLGHECFLSSIQEIHKILSCYFRDIKLCFYIRRQDDYLVSSWEQWSHKIGASLEKYVNQSLQNHLPDYLKIARLLEEVYGNASLHVVPIHRKAFKGDNLVSDFCQRIALDMPESLNSDIRANVGINPYLCDILYRLPHLYKSQHDYSIKNLLTCYIEGEDLLFKSGKSILEPSLRSRVVEHFRRDNEVLQSKYFNYLSVDEVFGLDAFPQTHSKEERLQLQIEELKNVMAIQMDLIIQLLRQSDKAE